MASNRYNYTWADALLAIDVSAENKQKREEQEAIEKKRRDEEKFGGWAGLALGGLGALAGLGPLGWTLGQTIGKLGADKYYDWEGDAENLEIGKFDQSKSISAREDYAEIAKDQDMAHAVDLAKDLAWTYAAAGGAEGYEAAKGADEKFWRTFGSTKDDPGGWTLADAYREGGGGVAGVVGAGKNLQRAVGSNAALELGKNILKTDDQNTGGFNDEATCAAAGFTWDAENQDCIMPVLEDQV